MPLTTAGRPLAVNRVVLPNLRWITADPALLWHHGFHTSANFSPAAQKTDGIVVWTRVLLTVKTGYPFQ
jgi:hypothetical protein